MMPFSVANLRDFPSPFSRLEYVQILTVGLLAQQEHEATVMDEQRVVMAVHLCNGTKKKHPVLEDTARA